MGVDVLLLTLWSDRGFPNPEKNLVPQSISIFAPDSSGMA